MPARFLGRLPETSCPLSTNSGLSAWSPPVRFLRFRTPGSPKNQWARIWTRRSWEMWFGRSWGDYVILFVVARTRLDRYDVLRGQFGHSREVKIVLDRREGERRALRPMFTGVNMRRVERRQAPTDLTKLGWSVIETDEPVS